MVEGGGGGGGGGGVGKEGKRCEIRPYHNKMGPQMTMYEHLGHLLRNLFRYNYVHFQISFISLLSFSKAFASHR